MDNYVAQMRQRQKEELRLLREKYGYTDEQLQLMLLGMLAQLGYKPVIEWRREPLVTITEELD